MLFRYFQWADLSVPVKHRSFIIEDPYDGRDGFKVTKNNDVMLHSKLADRDTYHREKLDIIFGKIFPYKQIHYNRRNIQGVTSCLVLVKLD